MNLNTEAINEAVEYWSEKGQEVEVYLHNTHALDLDEYSFNYRQAQSITKGYHGKGIFTHSGDSYFEKFGRQVYAILVKKGAGKSMEEEEGNAHIETFIPQSQVLEIVQL
jgi:hypothetical protein